MIVLLVVVALTLITISFRSPTAGALHDAQGLGSTVLRPFQIAATRVAQPFRDGYDYLSSLKSAKAENAKLKQQYRQVRAEAIRNHALYLQALQVEKLAHFEQGQTYPSGFRHVNAAVISYPTGPFTHSLVIRAGSSSGIRRNSPVVGGDGSLVGIISNVFPHTADVRLLTDPNSFVPATDLHTGVRGGVHTGTGGTLILDQVLKQNVVKKGDVIVTSGTRNARYPDLYPYGIPIGRVDSVHARDTETFLEVQVQPFTNFGALDAVAVLVPKNPRR